MSISVANRVIFLSADALFFATFYIGDPDTLRFASIAIYVSVLVTHRSINTWASTVSWNARWTAPSIIHTTLVRSASATQNVSAIERLTVWTAAAIINWLSTRFARLTRDFLAFVESF